MDLRSKGAGSQRPELGAQNSFENWSFGSLKELTIDPGKEPSATWRSYCTIVFWTVQSLPAVR